MLALVRPACPWPNGRRASMPRPVRAVDTLLELRLKYHFEWRVERPQSVNNSDNLGVRLRVLTLAGTNGWKIYDSCLADRAKLYFSKRGSKRDSFRWTELSQTSNCGRRPRRGSRATLGQVADEYVFVNLKHRRNALVMFNP